MGDAVRLAEIVQVLLKHGFADLLRRMSLHEGIPAKVLRGLKLVDTEERRQETLGHRLGAALTELGPTYIKLGQVLSTRPDLLGHEVCDELSRLQDRVDALPFDKMRPVVESSLARGIEEIFAEWNEMPVASASLSQVYRARLQDGTEVAVKVQRPGTREVVLADVSLLRSIAEWVAQNVQELRWFDSVGMVEEFERTIRRELDFTVEARTIEEFRSNFQGVEFVEIPRVYEDYSTAQVITMDWIDGVPLDELDQYAGRGCDPKVVAVHGCEAVCMQVFDHHLFHADPHPGNIFITRNNRFAFLDFGMVGRLDRADVAAMVDLLRSVLRKDAKNAVYAIMPFTRSGDVEDETAFEHDVAEYLAFEAQTIVAKGEVGRALERITDVLSRHRLQLASRFTLLIKALATVENSAHLLDPDLNTLDVIEPYVERMIRRRFSPFELWREGQHNLQTLVRIAQELPGHLHYLIRMARQGRLKVQITHEGLERLSAVIDRASNRVSFSVVAGSLIVGSSLLLGSGVGFRSLGLAGYVIAGILGFGLLISILRSRNY